MGHLPLILLALVLPLAAAPGRAPALAQSIARVALTQVGVADSPAVTGFGGVNCDPYTTLVGSYGPNADDCGLSKTFDIQNQNEPWCSDFVKWVWQRAGVTQDMSMLGSDASSFYAWGLQQHQKLRPDRGRPAVGDAVVFYPPGRITRYSGADHVGIVTGMNRDGTADLVNGDFTGPSDISVSYDERVRLTSWASRVWRRGEQWVLVAPPYRRQPAAQSLRIGGPGTAVDGTSVRFSAYSRGPVASYQWTFGDGGAWDIPGRAASHVFTQDGVYPVTVTATSWLGTATTRTLDVLVTGASSPVASVPEASESYSPAVDTYLFRTVAGRTVSGRSISGRSVAGGLTVGRREGRHWRYAAVPGRPDNGSGLTALTYPDPDAMTAHVYYISHGLLSETFLGISGWTFSPLAGWPAAGSAIAAVAGAPGPSVFYFAADGQLSSSAWNGDVWVLSRLRGPAATTVGSLALAATISGPELFYLHGHTLLAVRRAGTRWLTAPVRSPFGVAPESPLTAVSTGAHRADVFFIDGRGNLAMAAQGRHGWAVSQLPGTPAQLPGTPAQPPGTPEATSLMAAAYPLGRHSTSGAPTPVGIAVFYRTRAGRGRPGVTYSARGGWRSAVLRGSLAQDEAAWLR